MSMSAGVSKLATSFEPLNSGCQQSTSRSKKLVSTFFAKKTGPFSKLHLFSNMEDIFLADPQFPNCDLLGFVCEYIVPQVLTLVK